MVVSKGEVLVAKEESVVAKGEVDETQHEGEGDSWARGDAEITGTTRGGDLALLTRGGERGERGVCRENVATVEEESLRGGASRGVLLQRAGRVGAVQRALCTSRRGGSLVGTPSPTRESAGVAEELVTWCTVLRTRLLSTSPAYCTLAVHRTTLKDWARRGEGTHDMVGGVGAGVAGGVTRVAVRGVGTCGAN